MIRVLVYREGHALFARGLEVDILVQAFDMHELRDRFSQSVGYYQRKADGLGITLFELGRPAHSSWHEEWDRRSLEYSSHSFTLHLP